VTAEDRETRLRRLKIRSMRRGTKEMDLILMRYFEARRDAMGAQALDAYEALLEENDQELYAWVSGQAAPPERHADLVADIQSVLPAAE
jgi:antitoxin CptB